MPRAFLAALATFRAERVPSEDGREQIRVDLGLSDREIVEVLNALEAYVARRGGPARLNLGGREYTMHPPP